MLGIAAPMTVGATHVSPQAFTPVGVQGVDLVWLFPEGVNSPDGEGQVVAGSNDIRHDHNGVVYLFASEENRNLFAENPTKYLPGVGGYCLLGIHRRATGAKTNGELLPPAGDPRAATFANGRWYLHAGAGAKTDFEEGQSQEELDAKAALATAWFEKTLADHRD
jgi:YHS domain-containing protein